MTPTPNDISAWASGSFRDLTITEVVSEPKIQRWAWDFFNKPEDRLIEISLEVDGQAWETKWLLLNPGKTPTRCFLGRINKEVQAFLPLARVTGADTYCGPVPGLLLRRLHDVYRDYSRDFRHAVFVRPGGVFPLCRALAPVAPGARRGHARILKETCSPERINRHERSI